MVNSVSMGMLTTFQSTSMNGNGIRFGSDWYDELMSNLRACVGVVCILTPNSLERPWLLYEAGVVKGKDNRPVTGLAIGLSLNDVNTGPFMHFQNCECDQESLTKLMCETVAILPRAKPDEKVVKGVVNSFLADIEPLVAKEQDKINGEDRKVVDLFEETKKLIQSIKKEDNHIRVVSSHRKQAIYEQQITSRNYKQLLDSRLSASKPKNTEELTGLWVLHDILTTYATPSGSLTCMAVIDSLASGQEEVVKQELVRYVSVNRAFNLIAHSDPSFSGLYSHSEPNRVLKLIEITCEYFGWDVSELAK